MLRLALPSYMLRLALPSYMLLVVAIAIARFAFGVCRTSPGQDTTALLILASFTGIFSLGQDAVILTGGRDLLRERRQHLMGGRSCGQTTRTSR
jgi:ribose/xylose/arabinose/galactoside ABC-type transport system permease subunit